MKTYITFLLLFTISTIIKSNNDNKSLSPREWEQLERACSLGKLQLLHQLMIHHSSNLKVIVENEFPSSSLKNGALHLAALHNKKEIVLQLIKIGADLSVANSSGMTPLDIAIEKEYHELASILIRHGASLKKKNARPDVFCKTRQLYQDYKATTKLEPQQNSPSFSSNTSSYSPVGLTTVLIFLFISLYYAQNQIC